MKHPNRDERSPLAVRGLPHPTPGADLSGSQLEEVVSVIQRARELVGWEHAPEAGELADYATARRSLAVGWTRATRALSDVATFSDASRARDVIELLSAIKHVDEHVHSFCLGEVSSAMRVVRDAMAELHGVESVPALVELAPAAATSLGLDRVVLSKIAHLRWVTESAVFVNDSALATDLVEAGQKNPRTLDDGLLDTQMVQLQKPLLVTGAQDNPYVHRTLIDVSGCRSYVAAPIVGRHEVIGFMHADCFYQRRDPDPLDRDALWLFCEGLGQALARASLLESLTSGPNSLEDIADRENKLPQESNWHRPTGGDHHDHDRAERAQAVVGASHRSGRPAPEALTRREIEVAALMATGSTNRQIANSLVISEGTAKEHVKHILRKLGVANRASAISKWLQAGNAHN